eukprot:g3821.t1
MLWFKCRSDAEDLRLMQQRRDWQESEEEHSRKNDSSLTEDGMEDSEHQWSTRAARCTMETLSSFVQDIRTSMRLRRHAERLCERQPMRWCRDEAPRLVKRARGALCSYLGIDNPSCLTFLSNASAAMFAVLQATALEPGDVVLATETCYHSIGDALRHLCARAGAALRTVPLLPHGAACVRDSAQLLAAWEHGLREAMAHAAATGGCVKLAVLDHISSKPSVVFPAAGMVAACARCGVPTLVDGAHAPGSLPERSLALDAMDCDFYAMNFHKWMHAPRPCAGLYVRCGAGARGGARAWPWIDYSRLAPAVPAAGPPALSAEASYVTDSATQGHYDESTRDYASFVTLAACVALARRLETRVLRHRAAMVPLSARVLREACSIACAADSGAPDLVPPAMCASMANVRLPTTRMVRALSWRGAGAQGAPSPSPADATHTLQWAKGALHDALLAEFAIEVPVLVFRGELYLRVSLPLYIDGSAVARLAAALSSILAAGDAGDSADGGSCEPTSKL